MTAQVLLDVPSDRQPPALTRVMETLRQSREPLGARGIQQLWVFGSVVHGNADADSDVDLFAEFDESMPISPVTLASLRAQLSDLLGARADLVERRSLRPGVRETAERDAARIL